MSHKITEYKVRPLSFDPKLVEAVTERRKKGESLADVARALEIGNGKAAMGELIGTTKRITVSEPRALAKAIVKERRSGSSWGLLSARYGVTEGTARAAYEAATGEPANALDFRRKAKAS